MTRATGMQVLRLVFSGLVAVGLALAIRYGLVEPEGMAQLCQQATTLQCTLRDALVQLFVQQRLGYVALAAAVLAWWPRLRALAWLGWGAGLSGLVLYCWEPSAPAVLLALLLLAKPASASSTHTASQA